MPMYTFVCRECAQPFERKLRMSQSSDTQECPACGSMNTRKSIGTIAIAGISRSAAPAFSAQPTRSPFT
ncbi:MAG: zinc ribbon domain-containing protein [Chloroflexi bacterium]|jgi:putative FmdB family regulatory protein|nr:zinc ribbon domain-containing protein [Chloroflexota bacterium]